MFASKKKTAISGNTVFHLDGELFCELHFLTRTSQATDALIALLFPLKVLYDSKLRVFEHMIGVLRRS